MKKSFMIMPFGEPFDTYYNDIIRPAILKIGFKVLRADEVYTNRAIIEDIIEQIILSDIIIADVSGRNANVNYELGVAHALRKEVIIISQRIKDVPFDYRHIRTIIYNVRKLNWKKHLAAALQNTIKAVLNENFDRFEIKSLTKFYEEFSSGKLLGLSGVFSSRQSMNVYLDRLWAKPIKRLDIIAFGLKSFRDFRTNQVVKKVKEGMKVRILTMVPRSIFVTQREEDERVTTGSISETIVKLGEWCRDIRTKTKLSPSVKIKYYEALPLDFYWRQDDNIFIGPYLHGIDSQQTISFQFSKDSIIGSFYVSYFDDLWKDKKFSKTSYSKRSKNRP